MSDERPKVEHLQLVSVGEGFRFDADQLLEAAKGQRFGTLVIIGEIEGEDGLWISGSANAGESLILLERAKLQIIHPD